MQIKEILERLVLSRESNLTMDDIDPVIGFLDFRQQTLIKNISKSLMNAENEIGFVTFIFALCMLANGPPSQRLLFAFELYDLNERNPMDKESIKHIIYTSLESLRCLTLNSTKKEIIGINETEKKDIDTWLNDVLLKSTNEK